MDQGVGRVRIQIELEIGGSLTAIRAAHACAKERFLNKGKPASKKQLSLIPLMK
jgi:hypothetical protein